MARHGINLEHHLQKISILATKARYIDCIIRKAIGIEICPSNINTEDGFCPRRSMKSLV
jgi:hypothetical protein